MIIETKAHTCCKCHNKEIVKNGTNGCGNPQYHCKICGAYGVLDPRDRYTEEDKEWVVVYFKVVSDSDPSIQALAVTPPLPPGESRGEGIEKGISLDYRPCYHFKFIHYPIIIAESPLVELAPKDNRSGLTTLFPRELSESSNK